MSQKIETAPEMRLYSATGERLYLNKDERARFLLSANDESPIDRMFCQVLHDTGCRPSEALALFADRVQFEGTITFRTLKKRTHDGRGRVKLPQYRAVPVSLRLIENLDLVFGLRRLQRQKDSLAAQMPFWPMSRTTAYRLVKRVMARADIEGKQATAKGLRHAFGVAMITAAKPVPIHLLAKAMGHSSTKTTEVYLSVIGEEERSIFLDAWELS
ncbi:MAG: phage integrase family protein [Osedax symbiont Rs2]|nr:MAG: phage integrase family protein [Osedax symbiont Rs2]